MSKIGRPPIYTPELAAAICARLAKGESLRSICRDEGMPARSVVHEWVVYDTNGFADQYARAKEAGLDEMADELLDIADDGKNDWMAKNDPDNPGYVLNGEHSSRSRLRIDARKWYLSKLAPKRFGDRTSVELAGGTKNEVRIVSEFGEPDDGADLV